jgi:hypothetical protein
MRARGRRVSAHRCISHCFVKYSRTFASSDGTTALATRLSTARALCTADRSVRAWAMCRAPSTAVVRAHARPPPAAPWPRQHPPSPLQRGSRQWPSRRGHVHTLMLRRPSRRRALWQQPMRPW